MTWKERRIVTLLSTILLILMAALLVVLGIRYRENRAAAEEGGTVSTESGIAANQDMYTTLLYENGSTTLSFSRDELGFWRWDGNTDFPLDDTVISSILEQLTAWNPQQTLTDSKALENSGLDAPSASLTATTKSGTSMTLLFGKATVDGNSYYVRLNGDEKTVYIIADTLYKLMKVPIYDMCDMPELPTLTEERLLSITIRGAAGEEDGTGIITVLTAQRAEDDSVTTWRSSGANVTDLPIIQSLLEDITALSITKCIDYNPSEEAVAICGFEEPAAQLDISYSTEGGSEQSFSIAVGSRLPDGSGRYIQLGQDHTIYFLPTELLDPLMRIATEGLEG